MAAYERRIFALQEAEETLRPRRWVKVTPYPPVATAHSKELRGKSGQLKGWYGTGLLSLGSTGMQKMSISTTLSSHMHIIVCVRLPLCPKPVLETAACVKNHMVIYKDSHREHMVIHKELVFDVRLAVEVRWRTLPARARV